MNAASIPVASDTTVSLLNQQLEARVRPVHEGFAVELFRRAQYTGSPTNTVCPSCQWPEEDVAGSQALARKITAPPITRAQRPKTAEALPIQS